MYMINHPAQQYHFIPQQMMPMNNGQINTIPNNNNPHLTNPNTIAAYAAANPNSNLMINKIDSKKMDKSKKPKGRMSAYTFFVQTCREEHRKKHPNENVNFTEFSKKCAERWKQMTDKEKKRFADMAEKDKQRYDREMSNYVPAAGEGGRKKRKKDPNAPKRPLSAFFLYCADERAAIKAAHPTHSVGEVAKELGEKWNKVSPEVKAKYEAKAAGDKGRYEKQMAEYKKKGSVAVAQDDDDDEDDEE